MCIIERKTYDDYASSITDKRLKNQAMRITQLKKADPNLIVMYLIEGASISKDKKYRNGIDRNSIYSSIVNKVLRDNFTIFRSSNPNDTALILAKLYDKIPEHLDPSKQEQTDERLEYLKTIKLAKKDNMTPENCYLCQLAQIPGMSIDTANIIAEVYPSFRNLVLAYEECSSLKQKQLMLAELQIPIANDKTRRLGKVLSQRIYEFVCPPEKVKLKLKPLKIKLK